MLSLPAHLRFYAVARATCLPSYISHKDKVLIAACMACMLRILLASAITVMLLQNGSLLSSRRVQAAPDLLIARCTGIRKRAAIASGKDGAETLSASRAMGAIRRGEVAVLVIDAIECTESGRFVVPTQDFRLAELIANVGRACVVVVNKWDAVEKETNTLRVSCSDTRTSSAC